MGSEVHVIVVGDDAAALAHRARLRVADLEGRWSRFRADSELSMLNTGAGRPVPVSAETRTLVACATAGWRRSGGRFDPTVLPALVAAGYDRDYPALADAAKRSAPADGGAPGCGGVVVDDRAGTVTLPAGAAFDPGGIGKGLAADLVTAELLGAGAQGVCVNLGGDLVARGTSPHRAGWGVAVDDRLLPPAPTLLLADGAVATSSVLHRTWVRGGGAPSPPHRSPQRTVGLHRAGCGHGDRSHRLGGGGRREDRAARGDPGRRLGGTVGVRRRGPAVRPPRPGARRRRRRGLRRP
jgi:thiamine biosynthesis lipoprotein